MQELGETTETSATKETTKLEYDNIQQHFEGSAFGVWTVNCERLQQAAPWSHQLVDPNGGEHQRQGQ